MKPDLGKTIVLVLGAAILFAPDGLLAQGEKSEDHRLYFGLKGGYSLLPDAAAGAVYPGVYPNRPVFGVFMEERVSGEYWGWLEILYFDQTSFYDVIRRDSEGNIVAEYDVNCSRKYLEFVLGCKYRAESRTVTPFLMAGGAMSVVLNTLKRPDVFDPDQPGFKGPACSGIVGLGLEIATGPFLFSFDVRFDFLAERILSDRATPKPDAILLMAGIGF